LLLVSSLAMMPPPAAATHVPPPAVNGPVAFVVNSDIWYRSADGEYHQVTRGQLSPAWDLEISPDGRRIAFSIPARAGLWVVNLNGTNLRNVLAGYPELSGQRGYDPSWDPSGHRLVFTALSMRTGNHELYTVNADKASALRRLTDWGAGVTAVPAWSPVPGSNEIAYIPCQSICDNRIKIIDAVTGEERFVSDPDAPPAVAIDWSPDGTRLAVEAFSDGRLYTVDADGTDWVALDPNYTRSLYAPSWSPDGTSIALYGLAPGTDSTAIHLVDAATGVRGGVTSLTGDWGASEFGPTWGPECVSQCIGTELSAKVAKHPAELKVTGALKPGVARQPLKVTLYQKTTRGWKPVAAKTPTTGANGTYAVSFDRPNARSCGVLVEFKGSAKHMPSFKAVPPFRC